MKKFDVYVGDKKLKAEYTPELGEDFKPILGHDPQKELMRILQHEANAEYINDILKKHIHYNDIRLNLLNELTDHINANYTPKYVILLKEQENDRDH